MSSSSGEDQSPVARHRSSKPSGAQPSGAVSDQDLPQHDPEPPYYREVALSDIPSQYAEEVDTFRRILSLPDPRESMPRSSTSVMGLDDEKGRQELRPRGPSSILPLSSVIKDVFDKFQHDFKAANLPEGKYVKPPPSTSKWYRVGQPCYQDKYQELNTDFAKICITPKPSGGNRTSEAPGVVFDPIIGEGGVETPLPNDSSKASLSPPVGGRLRSFRRDWQTNKCSPNVLNIITNDYVLPFLSKPNLVRFPLILSEYKAHQKDQALASCIPSLLLKNTIERVENVKSLGFYSPLFLVPKSHQRWRPVIDLSRLNTFLHVKKGVGIVDRSVRRLPTHPHPSKLKEIPKVLLQVTGVPVHLLPIRTSHSPPGLYNDCKGSETNGPLQRTQSSPIPGRLADQVPVSGGSPSEHSGGGRPNSVLGLDNKSGKIRTETYSGVFVRGLRVPSRFSPCKTHSGEMAQTSGFDPKTQVKTCFDCKMFDVA